MSETFFWTARSVSPGQTREIGKKLGKKLKLGSVLTLHGGLGSGKTTFVKGVASGIGVRTRIASPTFAIVMRHRIPGKIPAYLFHIDLYRLKSTRDLVELGFKEIISNPRHITVIEWPERAYRMLSRKNRVMVSFSIPKSSVMDRERLISISNN